MVIWCRTPTPAVAGEGRLMLRAPGGAGDFLPSQEPVQLRNRASPPLLFLELLILMFKVPCQWSLESAKLMDVILLTPDDIA